MISLLKYVKRLLQSVKEQSAFCLCGGQVKKTKAEIAA